MLSLETNGLGGSVRSRFSLRVIWIVSLLVAPLVVLADTQSAEATGGGLTLSIRPDNRSHAWVKSQGFDAWSGGDCSTTNTASLTQNWGLDAPAAGCGVDNFQAFATGFLKAPVVGVFHFRVIANDAFDLDLNGKDVLKYWDSSTGAGKTFATSTAQAQTLQADTVYPIAFWYRDFTKEAHFRVQWKYPGSGDFQDIPTSALSSSAATLLGPANQQVTTCQLGIGLSPDCPAYSPQEIWDIHGVEADGEYWLLVAGQPTKVQVMMNPAFAGNRGRGFVQLMYIGPSNGGGYTGLSGAGSRFQYDSPLWTDQNLTLNAGAAHLSTSKRNTYNYTPVNKLMAIFVDGSFPSFAGVRNFATVYLNNGDVPSPPSAWNSSHFWIEDVPNYATGAPAYATFNSTVTRTESVTEPVTDRSLTSALATSNKTVTRYKIPINDTRKSNLLGIVENPLIADSSVRDRLVVAPGVGKYGAFSAARNPYNEWYGFNFKSQEWNGRDPRIKMRWGFFSMARQSSLSNDYYWEPTQNPHEGEAEHSTYYQRPYCTISGSPISTPGGEPCLGGLDRFLAVGGIGLATSDVAAYQPVEGSTPASQLAYAGSGDVKLKSYCDRPGENRSTTFPTAGGMQQSTGDYPCNYGTGIYGQMPDPSLADVTGVAAVAENDGFTVTWNAVAGATEYIFAHRKSGEPWKVSRIINPTSLQQFVAERGPGTYEFKVIARKFDSPLSINSSAVATVSAGVGVGLGGGDELIIASNETTVDLNAKMTSPLALSGLAPDARVGLTVTVTQASAAIATTTGLSASATQSVPVSSPVNLNSSTPSVTLYGTSAQVQGALDSITYQHINVANPAGSIKVEAFDAGTAEVLFNPSSKHYYKVVTKTSAIGFRSAYCEVKTGGTHAGGSQYDNCNSGLGRANFNGVPGYLATITSSDELDWLSGSGLLGNLVATTSIVNDATSGQRSDDDMWIGASDLDASSGSTDGDFSWTNQAPASERGDLVLDWASQGTLTDSAIPGIKAHQRSSSKFSMTLLKTSISSYPTYIFANADSGANDNVRSYLIEYSEDNGRNPLYTSRNIEFSLAPTITSASASAVSASGATVTVGVNPGNSPTTVELSYAQSGQSQTKSAAISPAVRETLGSSTATLSGLTPFTTYDYTVTAVNKGGVDSETGTFTTQAGPPESLALAATEVTSTAATLGASVRANAGSVISVTLEYGTDPNFASPVATSVNLPISGLAGTSAQAATTTVTGLRPETRYYSRTRVVNSGGESTSAASTFVTAVDLTPIADRFSPSSSAVTLPNGLAVSANHPRVFPANFQSSPAQDALYVSYTVTNTTPATEQDVWINLKDFSGGSVTPVVSSQNSRLIGDLAPGESRTEYFFLKASGITEVDQSHVVELTEGKPDSAAEIASTSVVFTFDAVRSPIASNSTITDTRFNTTAPPLGGDFSVTTTGSLNSFAANSESFFVSPATTSTWPAESLRLDALRMTFPGITDSVACPATVSDQQLLTNSCYRGQSFETTYSFKVIDTPASAINISPAVLTSSSGVLSSNVTADNPPVVTSLRPQSTLSVETTIPTPQTAPTETIGGVTYRRVNVEVDVTNTSLRTGELDQILVDLGPGAIIDPATARLVTPGGASPISVPISVSVIDQVNNIVAIDGPIPSTAGNDASVTFEVLVPTSGPNAGPTTVSAVGKTGDVVVGPIPGTQTTETITVSGAGSVGSTTASSSTPARLTSVAPTDVLPTAATLQGKLSDAPVNITAAFRIGQSPDLSVGTRDVTALPSRSSGATFEVITATVDGLTPGSTYFSQVLYGGVPTGEVSSFTIPREDQPFVALRSDPLPQVVICNEPELGCVTTVISPPAVSSNGSNLRYEVTAGSLPPGLSLDANSGIISGASVGSGGSYPFTLTASRTGGTPGTTVLARQTYNLISQPATAEPTITGVTVGNISLDSALVTAQTSHLPLGELITLVVKATVSGVETTVINEIIGEGTGSSNQLSSFHITGLTPSTTYSYRVIAGTPQSDWSTFLTTATPTVPIAPQIASSQARENTDGATELAVTIQNPLAGDAIGFVVGANSSLTNGRTYIAASANSSSEQVVSTRIAGLAPGNYFYRVLLGDGPVGQTYRFTVVSTSSPSNNSGDVAGPARTDPRKSDVRSDSRGPRTRPGVGSNLLTPGQNSTLNPGNERAQGLRAPSNFLVNTFTNQAPLLPGSPGMAVGGRGGALGGALGTFDVGAGVQSELDAFTPANSNQRPGAESSGLGNRSLPQMSSERLGGFGPPGSSTLVNILGARTGARFIVTESGVIDSAALIRAIESSTRNQTSDFFALNQIRKGEKPSDVPPPWSEAERQSVTEFFAASGLSAPVMISDAVVGSDSTWVQVSGSAQTYAPGTVVYLTVTSEPLIIGSAVVDANGFVEVAGSFPAELLAAGEHRIRLVGIRSIDGVSVDDRGEVQLSDQVMDEIKRFDLGTQATVAVIGSNVAGAMHAAIRVVPLVPLAPWWLLFLILAGFLLAGVSRYVGLLPTGGKRLVGAVVVLASALPAVILGWVSTVTSVTWWAIGLGLLAAAVSWFIPQRIATRSNR